MSKIVKDEKKIDELLSRGVETVYPGKEELRKKLLSGERIRLYCGFDPSASSLHIGNAIALNKLSQFQDLGHEVIFLVGDFTGMIGDPTDKAATRKKLTREEVVKNSESYQKQASAYLDFKGDNPARLERNSQWSDRLTFRDLIELSSNFTVQQMIQRDMFQRRLEEGKPIHLHEFLYPLAQGYDSVAMDVDLELGGNDQMFNMMAGRDLMKALGKRNKFVLTLKLLADEAGKKMGKSEGNAVFLDQLPADMYGAVMSWTDGVIVRGFELATKVPLSKVREAEQRLKKGENPRNLKMELAFELVKIVYGETAACRAQEDFVLKFQKKEVPDDVEEKTLSQKEWKLVDLLSECGLVESKSEAKRLIRQKAIKINGTVEANEEETIALAAEPVLLQRGKKAFLRVRLQG